MRTRRAAILTLTLTLALGARTPAAAGPWAGYAVLELAAHLTGIARPQCDDYERARQFLNAAVGAERAPVLCTERAFFDAEGFEPANYRGLPSVSGDGRYVAYESGGLVFGAEGPDGGAALLFTSVLVYDRLLGTTVPAGASSEGTPGNGSSGAPAISGDGRFIAFASNSSNLVPGDGNGAMDVFVRDLSTGATERVSVAAAGGDAGGASYAPSISWDGRYVAFESVATNLLPPGEDANGARDAFLRDRVSGTTERVSVATGGAEGDAHSRAAAVSASPDPALDGRWVAFVSDATNLLPGGADGNGLRDVFVRDRAAHATERASVASDGAEADGASQPGDFFGDARAPSVSADGRFVAFSSLASNLVPADGNGVEDVFLRDREGPATARVSEDPEAEAPEGDGASAHAALSADGRCVAFESAATNFHGASGAREVWVRDASDGALRRATVGGDGAAAQNGASQRPAISADGRFVAFGSDATNLIPTDGTDAIEVFVREWDLPAPYP